MSGDSLPVHSLGEAHLYVSVTLCPSCGRGNARPFETHQDSDDMVMQVRCVECAAERTLRFTLTEGQWPQGDAPDRGRINPTAEPSAIIDVAQWLTLFQIILDSAGKAADRETARELGYEAAQCLEEALKFYSADSDDPPADAFFSETTRQRFAEHPLHYRRGRLIAMRHKLPTLKRMEKQLDGAGGAGGKSWWRFWRRRS